MSNFEGLRDRNTLQQVASVATDRMRAGDFSQSGRIVYDPTTRVITTDANGNLKAISAVPFANNIIPPQPDLANRAEVAGILSKSHDPGRQHSEKLHSPGPNSDRLGQVYAAHRLQ